MSNEKLTALQEALNRYADASFNCGEWDDDREEPWDDVYAESERWRKVVEQMTADLIDALRATTACLEDWMEIADEEDKRGRDYAAVRASRAVLAETTREVTS